MDKENLMQAIYDYAENKYRGAGLYERFFSEFPEKDWDLPTDAAMKNFISWVLLEKVLPETGKTIAEEYADNTPGLSQEMKDRIYQFRNFIRSRFIVISCRGTELKIKDMKTQQTYYVKTENPIPSNTLVEGRIHPFGNHYRFNGIIRYATTPLILDPEVMMDYYGAQQIKRMEDTIFHHNSRLTAILNKYPYYWIDGIAQELGVKQRRKRDKILGIEAKLINDIPEVVARLPVESKDVLKLCLKNGGVVKYGMFRDYDDYMDFFWKEDAPKSAIGVLRQTGLLAVGRMPFGGRMFKVALIPADLQETLSQVLSDGKQQRLQENG